MSRPWAHLDTIGPGWLIRLMDPQQQGPERTFDPDQGPEMISTGGILNLKAEVCWKTTLTRELEAASQVAEVEDREGQRFGEAPQHLQGCCPSRGESGDAVSQKFLHR